MIDRLNTQQMRQIGLVRQRDENIREQSEGRTFLLALQKVEGRILSGGETILE